MSDVVSYDLADGIALIRVDNPPVNALSQAVRAGLSDAIARFETDAEARAAVLLGAGRTFVAGADISEFGQPPRPPGLGAIIDRIEAQQKPVVAVLHGTALGGGLELALGAHYRVAMPDARLGLPEVHLGIIPGAGGTQRLPRLAGSGAALDLITSGRHVPAEEALDLGIVDALSAESDPAEAGKVFAAALLAEGKGARPIRDMARPAPPAEGFDPWRERLRRETPGLVSPLACVDALEAATRNDLAEGLAAERRIFERMMDTPQREGLIHAFFAERRAAKLPELRGVEPRALSRIAVLGGGTMGTGIAAAALIAGLHVDLVERDGAAAQRARDALAKLLGGAERRGGLDPGDAGRLLSRRFTAGADDAPLCQADLLIEAVFEDMEVKKDVFRRLDRLARPGALLASNTSYLNIDELAAVTGRPADVIGLHFFSPAHVMKLLEVVVGQRTAPDAVATGFALARRLGKVAVCAGICEGFIGNRILSAYRAAADHMVLDGASPYQIDRVLTDFGFAMGPFAVADLAGLDIGWATRKRRAATRDPRERVPLFANMLCEKGWFGQKTGRGFYRYEEGSRRGSPDPEVEEVIEEARARADLTPRSFTDAEILRRYMAAMINEGARVVEDRIARRPLDVDVTLLHGYGFPRHWGGPMKYADMTGLDRILGDIRAYGEEDGFFWRPAPLLERLVAKGRNFDGLNAAD